MNHANFSKNLKEVLTTLGMTQAEFARRSGLSETLISNYMSGRRQPAVENLCKILSALPINFERLVAERPQAG